jgi:hypothetical protein
VVGVLFIFLEVLLAKIYEGALAINLHVNCDV